MKPSESKKVKRKKFRADINEGKLNRINKKFSTKKPILTKTFQTTLENSNMVGNIYFSNYSKWANIAKDLYLYRVLPNSFDKKNFKSEFVTTSCKVYHSQEAMPFDKIKVQLYINGVFDKGLDLSCKIFKYCDGDRVLLSRVSLIIMHVKYKGNSVEAIKLPDKLIKDIFNT